MNGVKRGQLQILQNLEDCGGLPFFSKSKKYIYSYKSIGAYKKNNKDKIKQNLEIPRKISYKKLSISYSWLLKVWGKWPKNCQKMIILYYN